MRQKTTAVNLLTWGHDRRGIARTIVLAIKIDVDILNFPSDLFFNRLITAFGGNNGVTAGRNQDQKTTALIGDSRMNKFLLAYPPDYLIPSH